MTVDLAALATYNAGVQRAREDYRRRMARYGDVERAARSAQTRREMARLAAAEGFDVARMRDAHGARAVGRRLDAQQLVYAAAYSRLGQRIRAARRKAAA